MSSLLLVSLLANVVNKLFATVCKYVVWLVFANEIFVTVRKDGAAREANMVNNLFPSVVGMVKERNLTICYSVRIADPSIVLY